MLHRIAQIILLIIACRIVFEICKVICDRFDLFVAEIFGVGFHHIGSIGGYGAASIFFESVGQVTFGFVGKGREAVASFGVDPVAAVAAVLGIELLPFVGEKRECQQH